MSGTYRFRVLRCVPPLFIQPLHCTWYVNFSVFKCIKIPYRCVATLAGLTLYHTVITLYMAVKRLFYTTMDRHGTVRSANPAFMSKIKTLRLTMCMCIHEASAMVSARLLLNANILVLVNSVGRGGVQTILFDLKTNSSNILCTGLEFVSLLYPWTPAPLPPVTGKRIIPSNRAAIASNGSVSFHVKHVACISGYVYISTRIKI